MKQSFDVYIAFEYDELLYFWKGSKTKVMIKVYLVRILTVCRYGAFEEKPQDHFSGLDFIIHLFS